MKLVMIRSSLLVSTFGLMTCTTFSPSVFAQSVDVPFNGTVPGACTFNNPTPGVVTPNNTFNPTALLGGTSSKGRSGFVQVNCNTSANVTISEPIQTGGFKFSPKSSYSNATLTGANLDFLETTGTSTLPLKAGITNFQVRMFSESTTVLPPGNYEFKVTLTITP
ncbi:MAG: hypothetical protein U7123_09105 [Potamolinea sp.]